MTQRQFRVLVAALAGALLTIALIALTAQAAFADRTATVKRTVDGDTVELESGERIRLLGIDAPESFSKSRGRILPAQPLGDEAAAALQALVDGATVRLVASARLTDAYQRTLAYLYLADGTDVQAEMLGQGWAMATAYPPDLSHFTAYRQIESDAKARAFGIWGNPYYAVQEVRPDANIRQKRDGPRRVKGVVTDAAFNRKSNHRAELTINQRLRLLISRAAWEEFWGGQTPQQMIGKSVVANGRLKTRKGKQTMWITHPVMLEIAP